MNHRLACELRIQKARTSLLLDHPFFGTLPCRLGGKSSRSVATTACDHAINPILLDADLTLPKDVLIDNRFRGMSAERIYNLIGRTTSKRFLRRVREPVWKWNGRAG